MELIAPRVFGPLSECSRHVIFENAIPGATVVLLRTRGSVTDKIGTAVATSSAGVVGLDPSQSLLGGDRISAYQFTATAASPWQADAPEVQKSDDKFNPPQVLSHLWSCSRGFTVGAMRPGTRVEILQGTSVIATGAATDGTAHVRVTGTNGLPGAGTVLTVRQRICPKPPPPGGAPEWVVDSQLPAVEPLQAAGVPGGELPAPLIAAGHSACSRSLTVEQVIPGAEVIVEDPARGWWVSRGPSDATSASLALPVSLKEGDKLEVRQEVECRMRSKRGHATVGPRVPLAQLTLFQIDCASSPTVYVGGLKAEADVEFEVVHEGVTKTYRSIATRTQGPFPAPPMPVGSTVRVRQGECENWSDWSAPQIAKALASPPSKLRIVGELFQCQNAIPVENIFPLAGVLVVRSSVTGEIARTSHFGNVTTIAVAPSLVKDHDITVDHLVCGQRESDGRRVKASAPPGIGNFDPQPFDGDTTVTLRDVTAGAWIEIWNQLERLQTGYAPFSSSGKVDVAFSLPKPLLRGQHIHAKFWHCGRYGRNEGRTVVLRKPELHAVNPSSVTVPSSDPTTFNVHGLHFRVGAMVWVTGGLVSTRFDSTTDLAAMVPGHLVDTPGKLQVQVRNPDGQTSGILEVQLVAQPAPPPPPPPPPPQPSTVGYDEVALYNCHTDRRDVHVWKRDLTTGGPFVFVGTLAQQYDGAWGTCPADGAQAQTIDLVNGHDTLIVAIDPESYGCIPPGGDPSAADPPATPDTLNAACARDSLIVRGKTGGGTLAHHIA